MLSKRLISSVLLIAFVIITIYVFPSSWFAIIAALFIGLSANELFTLFNNKGININKPLAVSLAMAMSPAAYFGVEESIFIPLILISLFLFQFTRKNNSEAIFSVSTALFGIFYVGWLFSFLVKIKLLEGGTGFVAYLLLVTKSSDIGAYIIGSRFGRHKLIPRLSPNKTIEGFIGAIAMSVAVSAAFTPRSQNPFTFLYLVGMGIILGLLAQAGDLTESLIKRDCGAKDAGRLFPGLGGMLDVIDSVLFTAPVFYYVTILIQK